MLEIENILFNFWCIVTGISLILGTYYAWSEKDYHAKIAGVVALLVGFFPLYILPVIGMGLILAVGWALHNIGSLLYKGALKIWPA